MKVSRAWLEKYFDQPLPPAARIAEALTFHAFEIEEADEDLIDVKVLPNRAADGLSHRGIAKELSAILDVPLKKDPLREPLPEFPKTQELSVAVEDSAKCPRYIGAVVKGVKVGPSPAWLKKALMSVGQRSINNVVDATNYVMLDLGQPLHAYDAATVRAHGEGYSLGVRTARAGETVTTLTNETYALPKGALVIVDATDTPIGIAGTKGGKKTEVTEATADLVVEAANFDGTTTRRAAQALKLFTEASLRFQNRPSPELCAYGMRDALALITEIAGGEVMSVTDLYPKKSEAREVRTSVERINGLLGSDFSREEVGSVFARLGLPAETKEGEFVVTPPFERTDIVIPEDLAEEIGRILGYDRIAAQELPPASEAPDQARFRGIERMKDQLVAQGFIEVSTTAFAKKGDVALANPLDKSKPALRTSLTENLAEALARAKLNAPLVLPPNAKPKLFEVGTVFPKSGEYLELRMTEAAWEGVPTHDNLSEAKLEEYGKDYEPKRYSLGAYKPFSAYPFVTRDIALWVPKGVTSATIEEHIRRYAGELLVRLDQFDTFEKGDRVSYAFRLVFQSFERTLTDDEVNSIMQKVSVPLAGAGYEVR